MRSFCCAAVFLLVLVSGAAGTNQILNISEMNVEFPEGTMDPGSEPFIVSCTPDIAGLEYEVASTVGWISLDPTNGICTPQGVTVTVNFAMSEMAAGTNGGVITCSAPAADNPIEEIEVTMVVTPVATALRRYPEDMGFVMVRGTTNWLAAQFEVWNGGSLSGQMDYSISSTSSWLSVSPTSGTSYGAVNLHALTLTNLAGMAVGQYFSTLDLYEGYTPVRTLDVSLDIFGESATPTYSTDLITVVTSQGLNAAPYMMRLGNTGEEPLPFRITSDQTWLFAIPNSAGVAGKMTNFVTVVFETAELPAGEFDGHLFFYAPTNITVPHAIPVELTVNAATSVPACTRWLTNIVAAGSGLSTQVLAVWNAGTGGLVYTLSESIDWLSISPTNGISDGSTQYHAVVFSTTGMTEGIHTGSLFLAAPAATPTGLDVSVTFQVDVLLAALPATVSNVGFVGEGVGGSIVQIWNAGSTNTIGYSIAETEDWLSVSPTSGLVSATPIPLGITYSTAERPAGVYREVLEISSSNQTLSVPVELRLGEYAAEFVERIVFASDREGASDLWITDNSGTWIEPLVQKAGVQSNPEISPDGTMLAYLDDSSGSNCLVIRHLISGVETTNEQFRDARWLPDSSGLMGLRGSDNRAIWRLSLDGVFTRWISEGMFSQVSPFGMNQRTNQLYYTMFEGADSYNSVIKALVRKGGLPYRTVIQTNDHCAEKNGRISPDSRRLLYGKSVSFGGTTKRIYLMDVHDKHEYPLSSGAEIYHGEETAPDFSPLGDRVVFQRSTGATNSLVVVDLATSNETTILSDTHFNGSPSWGILFQLPPISNVLMVQPRGLTNTFPQGGTGAVQALAVGNWGRGWLSWSISNSADWVWTSLSSGSSTGEIEQVEVGIDTESLAVGTNTGVLTFTANASNAPIQVHVYAVVEEALPVLSCDTTNLVCHVNRDSNTTKRLTVWNGGGRSLSYAFSTNRGWLSVSPSTGTSAGEEDEITVTFDSRGYSVGSYSGIVTLSSSVATQQIPAAMTVQEKNTNDPILTVSPLEITNITTRYRDASSKSFQVWNSGGKALVYHISEQIPWLRILPITSAAWPASSMGEKDTFTVHYTNYNVGMGSHVTNFHIYGTGGTQTMYVSLHVLSPLQHTLTVSTTPGGWVTPDTGLYFDMSQVTLTAHPSNEFTFVSWQNDAAGSLTQTVVRMDAAKTVQANFTNRTRVYGYVTNVMNGAPLRNARVRILDETAWADSAGYYSMYPDSGLVLLNADRDGYRPLMRGVAVFRYAQTRIDVGLEPNMVTGVRALQRPGTQLVDIYYRLTGPASDLYIPLLYLSQDGGRSWAVPIGSPRGDWCRPIPPSADERHIVWNAGANWEGRYSSRMRVAIAAAGRRFESPDFTVDTRGGQNWRIRVWADKNGNDTWDVGEQVEGAEVYPGIRRAGSASGVTDSDGFATVRRELVLGANLFVRGVVHTESADKAGHGSVDNTKYTVTMDNDIGGNDTDVWDGEWRGYTVTHEDLAVVGAGNPLYVQLKHPVFEFNLLVAFAGSSTDTVARLMTCVSNASTYLYDVTDGQMKLGKVRVRSRVGTDSDEWDNADVHILDNDSHWPESHRNGLNSPYRRHIIMGRRKTLKDRSVQEPDHARYIESLVHEFGHYGLNYYDEYLSGTTDQSTFNAYRAARTNQYPADYGLMDDTWSELSSYNDYPASYRWSGVADAHKFTKQIWKNNMNGGGAPYPCWKWLKWTFDGDYSGYRVRLTDPPFGTFVNGASTSQDRNGPTSIPPPYVTCYVFTTATYGAMSAPKSSPPPVLRAPDVLVEMNDEPVSGARVALAPAAGGPIRMLGRTHRDGHMDIPDVWEGDVLHAYHDGHAASRTITDKDAGESLIRIELAGAPDKKGLWPLSTNRLGIVATGLLASSNEWDIRLQCSIPLASNPVVHIYPDGLATNLLVLEALDAVTYTGRLPFADSVGGLLQIDAQPGTGPFFSTLDSYALFDLDDDEDECWSHDGNAFLSFAPGAVTNSNVALVYQGEGPVILSTNLTATNQVGPMVYLALRDPGAFTEDETAALSIHYYPADTAGVDESSIRLYRWVNGAWSEVPSGLRMDRGIASATISNLGAYVLLANSTADITPPSAVTDLVAVAGNGPGEVRLNWTAPGNDGTSGTACVYYLRYSQQEVFPTNWEDAMPFTPFTKPQPAGTPQEYTVRMPASDRYYSFALRAADEAGNLGDVTNYAAARSGMTDADGDGIPDDWLASVNLGRVTPMAAEDDVDNDGLNTWEEYDGGTDPGRWDSDGDTMGDGWEIEYGLNPTDPEDGDLDSDGDTLTNEEEYGHGTHPGSEDTDGDGMPDNWELVRELDALTGAEDEGAAHDPDGDQFSNMEEYIADTWPKDGDSFFRISDALWTSGLQFTFPCSTARVYEVDVSGGLTPDPEWQMLVQPGPFYGPGATETLTVTNSEAPAGIYRLRVRKP